MPDTQHFAAPLLRKTEGMAFHIIPLPDEVAEPFLATRTRRVLATLNGHTVRRAIQTRAGGVEPHLVISRDLMRTLGLAIGDTVFVDLVPDPEPEAVDVPDELHAALEQDDAAAERFWEMTPGKQRGLAHYVSSAKRPATREKRALELAYKLRTYTLYGDSEAT